MSYPANSRLKYNILASIFAALTAVGAFIRIPIPYVPLTLQTLFVMIAGGVLGSRYGAFSQIIYLVVGLLGLPVFANGGGLGYIFQPTFGYLLSYPLAAFVIGFILERRRRRNAQLNWLDYALAILPGMALIYLVGVAGLYLNWKWILAEPKPVGYAIYVGCIAFLPGTILKMVIAIYLIPKLARIGQFNPDDK